MSTIAWKLHTKQNQDPLAFYDFDNAGQSNTSMGYVLDPISLKDIYWDYHSPLTVSDLTRIGHRASGPNHVACREQH